MRIEKLADDRVKVTLTSADLTHMDIKIEQLTPNSKELHMFLFHVMETIREETGFNPYSGQVVVEATPLKDGMSIIVSKLKNEKKHITREQFKKIKSIKPKIKSDDIIFKMYYFDDFEILCDALVKIQKEAAESGALYKLGNEYCVMIKNDKRFLNSDYILSEFSLKKSVYPMQAEHVKEHWTLIAKQGKLADMINGISILKCEYNQ